MKSLYARKTERFQFWASSTSAHKTATNTRPEALEGRLADAVFRASKFFYRLLFTGFLFFTFSVGFSQKVKFSDTLTKANNLFDGNSFTQALPLYRYLLDNDTDKKKQGLYKYRLGICSLYKTDQLENALTLLKEVMEENKKAADIEFYVGRAYMLNYKFDDAIVHFASYMIKPKAAPPLKELSDRYIQNCKNGKEFLANPQPVQITNLGEPVNTSASEYVPVISSDESVLIFTYRGERSTGGLQILDASVAGGEYTEDVMMSVKAGDQWLEPFGSGNNINSLDHDACIALSGDGQKLLVFKNNGKDNGDLYMSTLDGNNWRVPEHLQGDVNSDHWEGSCSISANEKTLYFSSERPGGFGGRDLYKATLQHDGSWGEVKNLGPKINTIYHDDAPFIHPDGTTLIFSSEGHSSMGGYDIFKTFRLDTSWSQPENMGYPINTPGDDIYYVLSADGKRGYYSSEKAGGFGQQDIYVVGPGLTGWKPSVITLKGTITVNDQPTKADVEVVLSNNNENIGIYKSNSLTGKYLVNMPAGAGYKVVYRKFGYEEQTKMITNTSPDSYSEVIHDVAFYDKLSLTHVDLFGKPINLAEQKGYSKFHFSGLPSDTLLLFLLEGKTADSVKEVALTVGEASHTLTRCRGKYFCLRAPVTAAATPAAAAPETGRVNEEVPYGKAGNYAEIVSSFGSIAAEGLEFKVQIGAYRNPQNFRYENLTSLGKVSNKTYDDQLTRFTMGSFSTLNDADKLLGQVHGKGRTDAFVTAFYNGKRFLLRDLGTLKK